MTYLFIYLNAVIQL